MTSIKEVEHSEEASSISQISDFPEVVNKLYSGKVPWVDEISG